MARPNRTAAKLALATAGPGLWLAPDSGCPWLELSTLAKNQPFHFHNDTKFHIPKP